MTSRPFHVIAPMPRLTGDGQAWAKELRRIEDLGFHAVGVSEHFTPRLGAGRPHRDEVRPGRHLPALLQ